MAAPLSFDTCKCWPVAKGTAGTHTSPCCLQQSARELPCAEEQLLKMCTSVRSVR